VRVTEQSGQEIITVTLSPAPIPERDDEAVPEE
jgi:hypothetical protein